MVIDEKSLLAVSDPLVLLLLFGVVVVVSYVCARLKRNTNDFAGSVKIFIPVLLVVDVLFWVTDVPIILLLGFDIMGFVILALISNYFFYHS